MVDVDVMADDSFDEFKIILNNNKIIKSAISLEQVKNILYLAYEGLSLAVVNEKDSQSQIPIFLRLDEERIFKSNQKDDILNKLSNLKLINKNGFDNLFK